MKKKMVCFLDKNENVILKRKLTALPLKEEYVIKKSIEFFNDPEPCMIHRSAVMKRMFMEMDEYFDQIKLSGMAKVKWSEVPEFMKNYIEISQDVQFVFVEQSD